MTRIEDTQTVIVKLGFLGDSREGIGSGTFTVHSEMTVDEMSAEMLRAINVAFHQAHKASVEIYKSVVRQTFLDRFYGDSDESD